MGPNCNRLWGTEGKKKNFGPLLIILSVVCHCAAFDMHFMSIWWAFHVHFMLISCSLHVRFKLFCTSMILACDLDDEVWCCSTQLLWRQAIPATNPGEICHLGCRLNRVIARSMNASKWLDSNRSTSFRHAVLFTVYTVSLEYFLKEILCVGTWAPPQLVGLNITSRIMR